MLFLILATASSSIRPNFSIHVVRERNCLFWILIILFLIIGPPLKTHLSLWGHVSLYLLIAIQKKKKKNFIYWFIYFGLVVATGCAILLAVISIAFLCLPNCDLDRHVCRSSWIFVCCLCWLWYYHMVCNQVRYFIFLYMKINVPGNLLVFIH